MDYDCIGTRYFVFGRLHGSSNANFQALHKLALIPDTRIVGAGHQNEVAWRMVDGALLFFHRDGHPTTRFDAQFPAAFVRGTTEENGRTHPSALPKGGEILIGPCLVAPYTHFLYPYRSIAEGGARVLYLISSNVAFAWPRAALLGQLREAGVPAKQIWATVSGSPCDEVRQSDGITFSHVRENAFEYTALLDIARRDLPVDYVMLLHDTCHVGPRFKQLVEAQPVTLAWDYMSVASNGKFNMGLYRKQFLIEQLPFLRSLDGAPKKLAIDIELNRGGLGFKTRAAITTNFLDGRRKGTGFHPVYASDVFRKGTYLPGADIHKFHGRWRRTPSGWQLVAQRDCP
jgi:hypothetical protein